MQFEAKKPKCVSVYLFDSKIIAVEKLHYMFLLIRTQMIPVNFASMFFCTNTPYLLFLLFKHHTIVLFWILNLVNLRDNFDLTIFVSFSDDFDPFVSSFLFVFCRIKTGHKRF